MSSKPDDLEAVRSIADTLSIVWCACTGRSRRKARVGREPDRCRARIVTPRQPDRAVGAMGLVALAAWPDPP